MKRTFWATASVFFLFLVWIIASVSVSQEWILPGPVSVVRAFFAIFVSPTDLTALGSTLFRLATAMAIALLAGLFLGALGALRPGFGHFMNPIVTVLRTVPVISIVVIVLILAGFVRTPYIITFLMIFPLFYQAVADGIRSINPELVEVFRMEDDRFFSGLWYCYLPLIGNQIQTALLQSAGLGIKVLVMAEFLAQTQPSIGNMLYLEKVNLRFDAVFAWTLLLILLAVGLEILIQAVSKKREAVGQAIPKRNKLD
jgi:NitT/TauT family transport system permease protein